ncbi:unnamed protein product [Closterium sp. Naga37s-1]|nr:unnamed protein product [Closterium sp. Naga37s-1]
MQQFSLNERIFCLTTVTDTHHDVPEGIFARVWDVDSSDEAALLPQVRPPPPGPFPVHRGAAQNPQLPCVTPSFATALLPALPDCSLPPFHPWLLQNNPPFTEVLHFDSQQPCIAPSSATALVLRADGAIALWTASQCTHHTVTSHRLTADDVTSDAVSCHAVSSETVTAPLASNQVAPRRAWSQGPITTIHPPQQSQQDLVYLPHHPVMHPLSASASPATAALSSSASAASDENGGNAGSSGDDREGDSNRNRDRDSSECMVADSNWRWLVMARGAIAEVYDFLVG